ncbi:hypothetical protein [Paraburkholderia tropica]|uniref:hypothetical protein n=1 Tax=Paraburkholderia tropica TaxID=92647 RepID=UPI002AB1B67E|nr:hypothetical protein [Paraburkholderia tropica]
MSNENKQNDERAAVPTAWKNTFDGLLAYVLQDDLHNRFTPRIIDIAYTAFMSGATGKNTDDGGKCDWFNDTRPAILDAIAKLSKDLDEARATQQATKGDERAASQEVVTLPALCANDCLLPEARANTPSPVAGRAVGVMATFSGKHGMTWLVDPESLPEGTKIYAGTISGSAGQAPEGWKLVPVEPTPEMVDALWDGLPKGFTFSNYTPRGVIASIISAAPSLATDAGAVLTRRQVRVINRAINYFDSTVHPVPDGIVNDLRALLAAHPTEQRMSDAARDAEDAARYRWLKANTRAFSLDMGGNHRYDPSRAFMKLRGPSLDDAFDAARNAEIERQGGEA